MKERDALSEKKGAEDGPLSQTDNCLLSVKRDLKAVSLVTGDLMLDSQK